MGVRAWSVCGKVAIKGRRGAMMTVAAARSAKSLSVMDAWVEGVGRPLGGGVSVGGCARVVRMSGFLRNR